MPISHRRCIVQYNTDVSLVVVLCLLTAPGQSLPNVCKKWQQSPRKMDYGGMNVNNFSLVGGLIV